MNGEFNWPALNINGKEWSAVKMGDAVDSKVRKVSTGKSLKDAIK
jgi:hypothetical protein